MKNFLLLLLFVVVVLVVYNLLKIFLLGKIKISKWIVLTLAIIAFIVSLIPFGGQVLMLVKTGLFMMFLMWFIDISMGNIPGYKKNKNEKQIKIKPKAKPNRVKNQQEDKK